MKKLKSYVHRFCIIFIVLSILTIFLTGCIGSRPPRYVIAEKEDIQTERETIYGQENVTARQSTAQKTIAVSSEAVLKISPNLINIIIAVITEKPTGSESVNENALAVKGVINALSGLGISDLKIQTQGFNLSPLYNYAENMPPSIYAYQTISTLKITTTTLEGTGDIIATAIEAGANEVSSISYDLSEELKKETKNRALFSAMKDADIKAEAIAEAMAGDIVEILAVNEKGTSFSNPVYRAEKGGMLAMTQSADTASPDMLPQEIEVRSEIEVVYIFK